MSTRASKGGLCSACPRSSHRALQCPKLECPFCGAQGHRWRDCPVKEAFIPVVCPTPRRCQRTLCVGCRKVGHLFDECPTQGDWSCLNCDAKGHYYLTCPVEKRRKNVCWLCSEHGHINATCPRRFFWICPCYRNGKRAERSAQGLEETLPARGSEGPDGEEKVPVLLHPGWKLLEQGKYTEAVEVFTSSSVRELDNGILYAARGLALARCDRYYEASGCFRLAVSSRERRLCSWEEVSEEVNRMLDRLGFPASSSDPQMGTLRAIGHFLAGDVAEASSVITKAVEGRPSSEVIQHLKSQIEAVFENTRSGLELHDRLDMQGAIAQYTAALNRLDSGTDEFEGGNLRAKLLVIRVEAILHEKPDAETQQRCLDDLEQALRLTPTYEHAVFLRAIVHACMGKNNAAAREFHQSAGLNWNL